VGYVPPWLTASCIDIFSFLTDVPEVDVKADVTTQIVEELHSRSGILFVNQAPNLCGVIASMRVGSQIVVSLMLQPQGDSVLDVYSSTRFASSSVPSYIVTKTRLLQQVLESDHPFLFIIGGLSRSLLSMFWLQWTMGTMPRWIVIQNTPHVHPEEKQWRYLFNASSKRATK
jgi:hypothetical protein